MKKILRGIGLGFLAVVVILVVVVCRFLFTDPNKDNNTTTTNAPTVTDVAGTTYYALTDSSSGKTYVVVTDVNGNRYSAEFDGQNVGSTVANVNDQVAADKLPSNYNGPHIDVTASSGGYYGTTNQVTTTTQPQQNETTTTQTPEVVEYKSAKYKEIFKSNNFLMQIDDPDLGPVTMAMKNGNIYMEASMEAISLKMLYQKSSGKWYLLFDGFKKYSEMPSDMFGDMNPDSLTSGFADETNAPITVSAVDIDGNLLVCESTIDGEGNTVNYYFDGDVLVRSDIISPDGSSSSTYFTRVTTDVPDSLFEIPSNYDYMNIKWLMNLIGQ